MTVRRKEKIKSRSDAVSRAYEAAKYLQPQSFYVPKKVIDQLPRLRRLPNGLPIQKRKALQRAAYDAVLDYSVAPKAQELSEKVAKLKVLGKAAQALARAWSDVDLDHSLRGAVGNSFRRLPLGSSPKDHLAAKMRFDVFKACLDDDLWHLVGSLKPIMDSVKNADRISDPALYMCITRIALAWRDATGKSPTMSRNQDTGKQGTPFQRYLEIALPNGGGLRDHLIREVLKSLK